MKRLGPCEFYTCRPPRYAPGPPGRGDGRAKPISSTNLSAHAVFLARVSKFANTEFAKTGTGAAEAKIRLSGSLLSWKGLSMKRPLCRRTIERLLNRKGLTVKQIAAHYEVGYFDIYSFIEKKQIPVTFPKSGRRIPAEKMVEAKRLLLESNMPILDIAKQLGLQSRSSIYCLRDRLEKEKQREAVEEENANGKSFAKANDIKRCPEHGKTSVWPCVACEAIAYRKRHASAWVQLLGQTG